MRRLLWVSAIVLLASASRAWAASPAVTAAATPARGAAPLAVTLEAAGDSASYRWDFGDGSFGEGTPVSHTYAAGSWTATVTATAASGETSTAQVAVVATAVTAAAPSRVRYGRQVVVSGALVPAEAGTAVALYRGQREIAVAHTGATGAFRLRVARITSPGPYVVRTAETTSPPLTIELRPLLVTGFAGSGTLHGALALRVSARPAGAGTLRIRIWRGSRLVSQVRRRGAARIRVDTSRVANVRAEVVLEPDDGYIGARRILRTTVVVPTLSLGATGPSVLALAQRLAAMHYALRAVDSTFGDDDYQAVLAFQKVHGLARTGRVDAALWRRIFASSTPLARYPGTHVEVDKARQVLFEVRDGKVVLVVHVSTGATGNTPVGLWHIYRRVGGWDWVLYYPSYFLRGFAIHGYPDVPAYPASHGCVRVPLWVATRLYAMQSFGEAVYVYL